MEPARKPLALGIVSLLDSVILILGTVLELCSTYWQYDLGAPRLGNVSTRVDR